MQLLVYPVTVCFSWYAIPKESVDNITPMSDQKKTHKNSTVRFKTDNNG